LLAVLALAPTVFAQDGAELDDMVEKDILEVAVFGGLSLPMGGLGDWTSVGALGEPQDMGAKTGFSFGFNLGYFLTANMVLGADMSVNQYSIDTEESVLDSRNHIMYGALAYYKYYFFSESNFAPYLKGSVGVVIPKFTTIVQDHGLGVYEYRDLSYDPSFAFGLGAGAFYYTHDFGGLLVEVDYVHGMTDGTKGKYQGTEYEFGENTSLLDIRGGIKVFFGPK
jgi:hypothetical protein